MVRCLGYDMRYMVKVCMPIPLSHGLWMQ